MRKLILSTIVGFVLSCSGPAWAEEGVANFKSVAGSVTLERGGKAAATEPGGRLLVGDVLRTGADGEAGISFVDGTRVSVGPNSELEVVEYRFRPINKDYAFDLLMKRGEAAYSSGRLGKLAPDAVKFRTPQATLGIRGTKFLVRVE